MSSNDPLGWRESTSNPARGYGTVLRHLHTYTEGDPASMTRIHHSTTTNLRGRLASLEREADRLRARLDAYGDDVYDVGAVLVWDKQFAGSAKTYSYAAIKTTPLSWYITGRNAASPLSWDQLIDCIVDEAAELPTLYAVTQYEEHTP